MKYTINFMYFLLSEVLLLLKNTSTRVSHVFFLLDSTDPHER